MLAWLKHARIGLKLALAPGAAFAGLLLLAVGAYALLDTIQGDIKYLDGTAFGRVEAAARLQVALSQAETKVYEIAALAANSQDAKTLAARSQALETALGVVSTLTLEMKAANPDAAPLTERIRDWQKVATTASEMLKSDAALGLAFMWSADDAFGKVTTELKRLAHDTDEARTATASTALSKITRAKTGSTGLVVLILLLVAVITVVAVGEINRPLAALTSVMSKLAAGDLEVDIPGTERRDEIGAMADAVEVFKANAIRNQALEEEKRAAMLRRQARSERLDADVGMFETEARALSDALARSAAELRATAERMSHASTDVNRQACAASSAANAASTRTGIVAASAEELAGSSTEIARQVAKCSSITTRAARDARDTNEAVEGLANSAQRIGEITGLIQTIARQTNLLALNATIEAARAGEHGKGFAVVASEVKTLANQTARAAEEISAQIAAIQGTTGQTVVAIRQIAGTIAEVNEITTAISLAVEEQGGATTKIAGTVAQAAHDTTEVSTNIAGVTETSDQVGQVSNEVLAAADSLSQRANRLRHEVEGFLAKVRAA